MSYLIDTDIIIYSIKGNEVVRQHFAAHSDSLKSISVVTYGELVYGARRSADEARNMATARRIAELFPVIGVSKPIIEAFAEIKALLHKKGTPVDDMDLLIAATALHHNCILVTNNQRHFSLVPGLSIENWAKTS